MDESRWIKKFLAKCTCDGVTVATALAKYIDREGMRLNSGRRWKLLVRKCALWLSKSSIDTGQSRPSTDHPVQRGTGVWGNELDHGSLFLIEELHIAALELRRKGLARNRVSTSEQSQTVLPR
jgi:hypothetical protein